MYKQKYLKYKQKYLRLKQSGGIPENTKQLPPLNNKKGVTKPPLPPIRESILPSFEEAWGLPPKELIPINKQGEGYLYNPCVVYSDKKLFDKCPDFENLKIVQITPSYNKKENKEKTIEYIKTLKELEVLIFRDICNFSEYGSDTVDTIIIHNINNEYEPEPLFKSKSFSKSKTSSKSKTDCITNQYAFENYPNLETLIFYNCKMDIDPGMIFKRKETNKNIKTLKFIKCGLTSVNNLITFFGENIDSRYLFEEFDFSDNYIKKLPDNFYKINVKKLNLSNNYLFKNKSNNELLYNKIKESNRIMILWLPSNLKDIVVDNNQVAAIMFILNYIKNNNDNYPKKEKEPSYNTYPINISIKSNQPIKYTPKPDNLGDEQSQNSPSLIQDINPLSEEQAPEINRDVITRITDNEVAYSKAIINKKGIDNKRDVNTKMYDELQKNELQKNKLIEELRRLWVDYRQALFSRYGVRDDSDEEKLDNYVMDQENKIREWYIKNNIIDILNESTRNLDK